MSGVQVENSQDSVTAEVVEDLIDQIQAGEGDVEAFIARHPEQEAAIRRLLPALQMMADLSQSARRPLDLEGTLRVQFSGDGTRSVPTTLGDFRIVREVGRGGMGVVYEAEQISLRRRVALKMLPFASALDPRQLQRFRNEALAAASLHHDHIIPVYAVGCERGVHFYAMQFVDGLTLAEVIAELRRQATGGDNRGKGREESTEESEGSKEGTFLKNPSLPLLPSVQTASACARSAPSPFPLLPPVQSPGSVLADTKPIASLLTERSGLRSKSVYRRAAELVADAADALEHAHSLGIVHRDIKPGNLLLDQAGKICVGDFGLARFGSDAGLTMTGDVLGTLRYMAPEQALAKHGLVDHRADIYALGATLYELLTLRPAVAANERGEILRQIAFEEVEPLHRHDKHIAAELETIALKCLAKAPVDRYASAGDLAADLRCWLADKPIKARPPTAMQRVRKWSQQHQAVVLAVCATLLLGMAVSTWQAIRATQAEAKAKQQEQNATALATAEAAQRKLADKNFEAALDAVDRMLANIADPELNEIPRVGPLRRKMLKDAIAFYEQLPAHSGLSPEIRFRLGKTWSSIGNRTQNVDEYELSKEAFARAIDAFQQLVLEQPEKIEYHATLAACLTTAGWLHNGRLHDRQTAETLFRRASEVYAGLVASGREDRSVLIHFAHSLGAFSYFANSESESHERLMRAAEILDHADATELERAPINFRLALLIHLAQPAEADKLFRRAIAAYRQRVQSGTADPSEVIEYPHKLWSGAVQGTFWRRSPAESEGWLDESIALYRNTYQANRGQSYYFVRSLRDQANILRLRAAQHGPDGWERAEPLLSKANALASEAMSVQRGMISRFTLVKDREVLVAMLRDEARFLLTNGARPTAEMASARGRGIEMLAHNSAAQGLLAEALELCRVLSAEFPDNADHKNRLDALLKLQAEHFGKRKEVKKPESQATTSSPPDGG